MKKNVPEGIYELHAALCRTLAHPRRLKVLTLLREGEKSVKELLAVIKTNKANLSQHLTVLRNQRIVYTRRDGVNIYYRLTDKRMIEACDLIRQVLLNQLNESRRLLKKVGTLK